MGIEIHYHERCGKCGNIREFLNSRYIDYAGYFFPPQSERVKEIVGDGNKPVLFPDRESDEPIVGHGSIMEWLTRNHSD
ncbi:hypothetical protein [Haloarchaeobius sp. DFWS5]|uniref:hypothetical protein n=1 Tax=Haloarchaeobius sp. DFWS5 TaxID=3446114 RepID=UPI003EBDB38D